MNTINDQITGTFNTLNIDTTGFRTDGEATHRIGQTQRTLVQVSDHKQGRGQSVKIDDAELLDISVTSRRRSETAENVAPEHLTKTLRALIERVAPRTNSWYS